MTDDVDFKATDSVLIAAAYRTAAEACLAVTDDGHPQHIISVGYAELIKSLAPDCAEAHLRALMMDVARESFKLSGEGYNGEHGVDPDSCPLLAAKFSAVIDKVLGDDAG